MSRSSVLATVLMLAPFTVDWTGYGQGGQLQQLHNQTGCDDRSSSVSHGGVGGAVELRSLSSHDRDTYLSMRASGDLVAGQRQEGLLTPDDPTDDRRSRLNLYRGSLTLGASTRYIAIRGGIYVSNGDYDEEQLVAPAGSIRIGPSSSFLRLSVFDQAMCLPADCVAGAELGTEDVTAGASMGLTTGRFFAQARIPNVLGSVDLTLGARTSFPTDGARDSPSPAVFIGLANRIEFGTPVKTRYLRRPSDP